MAKRTPGLRKKGRIWQIEKVIAGELIRCSTGEEELEKAERYLAQLIEQRRKVVVYGERLERTFEVAAARYIEDNDHKRSLDRDIVTLKAVMHYLAEVPLLKIHAGTLEDFIKDRRRAGISAGTLNRDIAIIRRVLSLSARLWRYEQGRPWLDTVPMLPTIPGPKRKPKPITHGEQVRLLQAMPRYLADMCEFALNTGLRDQELCGLKWSDERSLSDGATVFVIEEERAKNSRERIIPLNATARRIVQHQPQTGEYVFSHQGQKLSRLNNRAWRKAVVVAGLQGVRVHDLRHTFGMRLRAAGVNLEDRQDLLGHHAGRITTHYSKAEIGRLIECVERLCEVEKPELTLLKKRG